MKTPPGVMTPAVVLCSVSLSVFQRGDRDNVYAVGALVGGV